MEEKWLSLDLSSCICFKLKPSGLAYIKYLNLFDPNYTFVALPDKEGWREISLRDLIYIFGPAMHYSDLSNYIETDLRVKISNDHWFYDIL